MTTHDEFTQLCTRWRRAGGDPRDPRGALTEITPETVHGALALVRDGEVVSCAGDAHFGTGEVVPGQPGPATLDVWYEAAEDWRATNDRLSVDVHGAHSLSHVDFPHHFFDHERNFHGLDPDQTRSHPTVDPAADGVLGRGVLLDVATALGGPVPAGTAVPAETLRRVIDDEHVELRPGDIVFVRFGADLGDGPRLDLSSGPGLHIECADLLLAQRPAVVVTDYGLDAAPSPVDGVAVPWHLLLLVHAGVRMVDAARLGRLARACTRRRRHEFLAALAPLRLPGASGSPVNPLAVF